MRELVILYEKLKLKCHLCGAEVSWNQIRQESRTTLFSFTD